MTIHNSHLHLKELDLVASVKEELTSLLSKVPFIPKNSFGVERPSKDERFDLMANIDIDGKKHVLLVEIKSVGQPRVAKSAVADISLLRNWIAHHPVGSKNVHYVFAAPFVSEASREICQDAGIGYIDLTGNCFISFANVYIERFGFQKDAEKRELKSLFNDKASRIVRRLLTDPERAWTVKELSKRAHVSLGLTSQVKTKLLDSEFVKRDGEQFRVARPELLLREWADNYRHKFKRHITVEFYSPNKLQDLEKQIAEYCRRSYVDYAFTLATAAKLTGTQYVSQVNRIHAYIEADVEKIGRELGLKQVDSGGNIVLMRPFDQDVLLGKRFSEEYTIVSDIQLYLDFAAQKGRLQETADVIFDTRIKLTWAAM